MSKNETQSYTPEFRAEAVKLVIEKGMAQEEAAKRLSIPKGTLGYRVAGARKGNMPVESGGLGVIELTAELARVRKELAEVRMERDILKKATAYFARESLPGTRS